MKTFELAGAARKDLGKKAAKLYRKEDEIPCVLYGGKEVVHFNVKKDSVRKLIYTPEIFLVELTLEGKKHIAIMKNAQFHPVSEALLHMDFLEVFDKKQVEMEVPVVLEGLSEGVKEGGKLVLEIRRLKVKGLYKNIPEKLVINVENLGLGKSIQIADLSFDNIQLLNAKNSVVCAVRLTRAARGAAAKSE